MDRSQQMIEYQQPPSPPPRSQGWSGRKIMLVIAAVSLSVVILFLGAMAFTWYLVYLGETGRP